MSPCKSPAGAKPPLRRCFLRRVHARRRGSRGGPLDAGSPRHTPKQHTNRPMCRRWCCQRACGPAPCPTALSGLSTSEPVLGSTFRLEGLQGRRRYLEDRFPDFQMPYEGGGGSAQRARDAQQ